MVAPQPFFRARGTPFSVLHRIRALVSRGHRVTLVTYPFGDSVDLDGLEIVRAARPPGIRDVAIGPSLGKLVLDMPLYAATRRLLRARSYDVLHSHEEAAFFCVGLARRHGLPHIYDMHSSLPQQLENFSRFDFGPIRSFFRWQEHRVLSTCDGIITICSDLARIAEDVAPDTPHSMIENTGDDSRVFRASKSDVRADFQLGNAEIVLYTGTLEHYQGIDLLIRAFELVTQQRPSAHLLVVGGTPEQIEKYRAMAASANVERHVSFTGTVHPREISAFLDVSSVIVSPRSSGTNTPLKIYGYMRSGRPIVATNRMTHTQVLSSETAKLVPDDERGLADGIVDILSHPERGEAIAAAARKFVDREFSDDSYVERVNGLLDTVMGSVNTARPRRSAA